MTVQSDNTNATLTRLVSVLPDWLGKRYPNSNNIEINNIRNPAQGFSNETWLFDLHWFRDGTLELQPMVLRLEAREPSTFQEYDVLVQYRCMDALCSSTVPVPKLFGFGADTSLLGARFYLMEGIEGQVPNENPLYHVEGWMHALSLEQRASLWMQGIDVIARIGAIEFNADQFEFLDQQKYGATPLDQMLGYFHNHMLWAESLNRPYPHLHRAYAWLNTNRPTDQPVALCWGDAKLGNCIYRNDGLVAALDWEGAHLGSPVADLAWWLTIDRCLSEGYEVPRLAGLPSREESVTRWEAVASRKANDLEYYEVFSAFKLSSIMARIGTVFQQRGLIPKNFAMDTENGAAKVLALLGAKHGY